MARLETFRHDWIGATSALRGRPSRTIGHNTALVSQWAAEDAARPVSVRFHSTDVVTYRPDGWVVIRSGGWETVTTANRLAQVMPDGWRIASHRVKGGASWWLYRDGRPILPFASGLAVNVETGAVGMTAGGDIGVILTADDIAAVVAAEDAARQLRADKRTARILAQHPQPRPVTYRADVPHDDYAAYQCPLSNPHGRAYPQDCASCAAESAAWRAIVAETLRADHANGHAWEVVFPDGGTISAPAHPCPYGCPDYAPYNYGTGY